MNSVDGTHGVCPREFFDKGETPGDSWGDAMSRRSVWDE